MTAPSEQRSPWVWIQAGISPAASRDLEAAAEATWRYAVYCAWSYLNDRDAAYDLMDYAMEKMCKYIGRSSSQLRTGKLSSRFHSLVKRRAKQLARRRQTEVALGTLADLANLYQNLKQQPHEEQRLYVQEVLDKISPQARAVAAWRMMGYSWRWIGSNLGIEHSNLRRAFLREVLAALKTSSGGGV